MELVKLHCLPPAHRAAKGSALKLGHCPAKGLLVKKITGPGFLLALVNPALISGLNVPAVPLAVGNSLFVTSENTRTIGEHATSGATVNASLISGLNYPTSRAVSGNNLFVANTFQNDSVEEFTTSGTPVNTSLITGLDHPWGMAMVPEPRPMFCLGGSLAGWMIRLRSIGQKPV